jgi:uncharacterized OB-fold protein
MSEPVRVFPSPVRLEYQVNAGRASSRFLRGMAEGRILGQRCPSCRKVYVPPRGSCPTCGVPTEEEVAVSETGTVTTFCVVNIHFESQAIELPFVYAWILLDGADVAMFHLIQEIPVSEVRMGLRVRAVWAGELRPTVESIRHFRPSGEPDAPYDSYARYL